MTVPMPAERANNDLATAVKRVRKGLPDPPLYTAVVAELKIDPTAPVMVRKPFRKEKKEGFGLTQRVWDSLRADGTYDPDRFVPFSICKTSELPLVVPRQRKPEPIDEEGPTVPLDQVADIINVD